MSADKLAARSLFRSDKGNDALKAFVFFDVRFFKFLGKLLDLVAKAKIRGRFTFAIHKNSLKICL